MKLILLGVLLTAFLVACPDPPPPSTTHAPSASFSAPSSGAALAALVFDASNSSDPDKDTLTYSWDFGDGVRGGGVKIAHEFSSGASFTVKLTVSDGKLEDSKTQIIAVSSLPVPTKTVTLAGLIMDTLGAKLEGVKVEIVGGSSNTLSLADGTVSLAGVGVGVPLTIKLSKVGFAEQYKTLELPPNAVSADAYFSAELKAREAAQVLDSSAGGALTGKDAAKLELPANALVDSNGNPISGNVNVNLTPINVTDANGIKGFPGSFTGIKPNGNSSLIVSHGTTEYALEQGGQRLNLADGKQASIEIPMYTNANLDGSSIKIGDTIPLWSLNEKTGDWVQESTGTVQASSSNPSQLVLQAKVTHFSWWNADAPADDLGNPKPKCIPDPLVPGGGDHFNNATICNVFGDNARVRGRAGQRQQAVNPPAFRYSTTIPIQGGVPLKVPAGIDLIFKGYALNGTWSGQTTYRAPKNSSEEVLIKIQPISTNPGGNVEAISAPWNKDYAFNSSSQTDQFTFGIPASESRRITVSHGNGSTLEGTARVLNGTQIISSANFTASSSAIIRLDTSANTDYTLEVTGTKNLPGGYNLMLEKIGVLGSETLTLPFLKDVPQSGLNKGDVYRYTFTGQANDPISAMLRANSKYPLTLLHNNQILATGQQSVSINSLVTTRLTSLLPETGTYMLEVGDAAAYTLVLQNPKRITLDSSINLGVTEVFPYPSVVFEGSKDAVVNLGYVHTDPTTQALSLVTFTAPDGTNLLNSGDGLNNRLTRSLPATGLYTVDFDPIVKVNTFTANLTLSVSSVTQPTVAPFNTSLLGSLATAGAKKFYTLSLQAGDVIHVVGQSATTLVPVFWLRSPVAGKAFFDFSSGIVPEVSFGMNAGKQAQSKVFTVNQAGDYVLEVMSLNKGIGEHSTPSDFGDYSLVVQKLSPINLNLDTAQTLNTEPSDALLFLFNISKAGYYNLATLETTPTSGLTGAVYAPELRDSSGAIVMPTSNANNGALTQLQPGMYTATFQFFGGSFNAGDSSLRNFVVSAASVELPVTLNAGVGLDGLIDQFNEFDYFQTQITTSGQPFTVRVTTQNGLQASVSAYKLGTDFTLNNSAGTNCSLEVAANQSADCTFTPSSVGIYIVAIRRSSVSPIQTGGYHVQLP